TTAHTVNQSKTAKAAMAHENHISTRQEACDQLNDLPGAIGQPLMPTLALGVVSLRWAKHSQEWQPPDATGPGDLNQQHATQPPQPTCLDKVRVRGANRIAVDPFGFDLLAAPSFDRVVDPNHQFAAGRKNRLVAQRYKIGGVCPHQQSHNFQNIKKLNKSLSLV